MLDRTLTRRALLPALLMAATATAQDGTGSRRGLTGSVPSPIDLSARAPEAPSDEEGFRRERDRPRRPQLRADASLMITDLRVIEDPVRTDGRRGAQATWSFRHLIENMAGNRDPSRFVMEWLSTWESEQVIDGLPLAARPSIRELVIDPWLERSGGRRLDLNRAPFQLLAIVNRMDLRQVDGEDVLSAGEGRFVFGLLDAEGRPLAPVAGPAPGGFLVIFEYGLPASDARELERWARDWSALSELPLGSPEYRDALERVTRGFTDAGRAPEKANGSALNQLRTNEISLAAPWELREFVIGDDSGFLDPHVVAITPDTVDLNGTEDFAALINDHEDQILDGSFVLDRSAWASASAAGPFVAADFPDFDERSFTAIELAPGLFDIPWSAEGISSNEARHAFALNTCNGCHRSETATGFVMVGFPAEHQLPMSLGAEAALAGFLTGIEATDPVDGVTVNEFDDLERRRVDLEELLASFGTGGPRPHRPRHVH